jgi:sulfite reductase beta subunit-like hemoprotein
MACSALYRESKLGRTLVDALDQLVEEGKLPPQLALRILEEVCKAPDHRRRILFCAGQAYCELGYCLTRRHLSRFLRRRSRSRQQSARVSGPPCCPD